jgi:hypothetical protein
MPLADSVLPDSVLPNVTYLLKLSFSSIVQDLFVWGGGVSKNGRMMNEWMDERMDLLRYVRIDTPCCLCS